MEVTGRSGQFLRVIQAHLVLNPANLKAQNFAFSTLTLLVFSVFAQKSYTVKAFLSCHILPTYTYTVKFTEKLSHVLCN